MLFVKNINNQKFKFNIYLTNKSLINKSDLQLVET